MHHRLRFAVGVLLAVGMGACIAGASSAASRALSVDDILRLHAAGVDEDVILSEIVVTDTLFDLGVEDILRLQEAGVSDRLLQFMVDTGRGDTEVPDPGIAAADDEDALPEDAAQEAYVEEQDVAHPDYVSLRWSYPVWWYDMYWYDYWYYDCHYDPWGVSWVYPCGVWYPTWYWSSRCWAPAGWASWVVSALAHQRGSACARCGAPRTPPRSGRPRPAAVDRCPMTALTTTLRMRANRGSSEKPAIHRQESAAHGENRVWGFTMGVRDTASERRCRATASRPKSISASRPLWVRHSSAIPSTSWRPPNANGCR